ncbi:MAG: hypothetical protein RJA98_1905 [Pseudomonadota bacterium]|jgi:hypothetical protein
MASIDRSPIQQLGNGNIVQLIGTSSEEGRPLTQCSVAELRAEQAWRKQLLERERGQQWTLAMKLLLWMLTGGGATWFSALWVHWNHWLTVALAALGLCLPGAWLYALSQGEPSEFALRQMNALREIGHLLREKGAA